MIILSNLKIIDDHECWYNSVLNLLSTIKLLSSFVIYSVSESKLIAIIKVFLEASLSETLIVTPWKL